MCFQTVLWKIVKVRLDCGIKINFRGLRGIVLEKKEKKIFSESGGRQKMLKGTFSQICTL